MYSKPLNIWLIDDDPFTNLLNEFILKNAFDKSELKQFESATEALSLLDKTTPDLIILDINMPQMNGWELAASLNKTHPKVPIVLISSSSESLENEYILQNENIKGCLVKPLTQEDIEQFTKDIFE
jgi:two-component SAPR family response regulator